MIRLKLSDWSGKVENCGQFQIKLQIQIILSLAKKKVKTALYQTFHPFQCYDHIWMN